MKKIVTLLFAAVVAFALTTPVFAKGHRKKHSETATTTEQGQAHKKHAKKKGATEGTKEGQQGTNPSQSPTQ